MRASRADILTMVGAHTPPRVVPARVRGTGGVRRGEGGFTIVELIVVLLIIAILVAVVLPTVGRTRDKVSAPEQNVVAGAIWRGIARYRIDNGTLPPASLLAGQATANPPGAGFADPGGQRYINRWPSDPKGKPAAVVVGSSASVPNATDPSRKGQVVYYAAGAQPISGYLVAYSQSGTIIFRRSIGTGAEAPIG